MYDHYLWSLYTQPPFLQPSGDTDTATPNIGVNTATDGCISNRFADPVWGE
jgi:hypothetical protein